ncbi:Npt1/Npt2 family nucleotide transporter [Deltaproteobacteria bacterium IMCC39524]|nr:Npt1/Npt2 family nucleotide transporter [Deltaproteobacteria bacterium IMCC39524]
MKDLLFRWLKIYEEEARLFIWSAFLLFFINVSQSLLNNYAETAFLKRFGVEYLPIMTAINAIVTFILLGVFGGKLTRFRSDKVVTGSLVVSAGLIGVMRFIVPFEISLIYPILYLLKTQFVVLMAFVFWNLANDLFSTRQSKRLFPLITTGGILGAILGSFATPLLISFTQADNLLLIVPSLIILGAFCSLKLAKAFPGTLLREEPTTAEKKSTMLDELRKVGPMIKTSTLAQVLLVLTLVPNIVIPIINYQFNFVVDQTFATEKGMISFFSYFRGAQNTISLILSLFVGRIYGRFGLPVALMFHPANYLIAFAAYLFQFNIFSAVYADTSVNVLRKTINAPATSALYGLLLPKDRAILRSFLRGTVVRVGILFGSGLLLVANEFIQPRYLSLFAIAFCTVWLGSTLILKREYSAILISLVQKSLPEFYKMGQEFKVIFKKANLGQPLLDRFQKAVGEEAQYCAEMLQNTEEPEFLDKVILDKLHTADDKTRLLLLPYLSDQAGSKALDVFLTLRDPGKPELMVALSKTARKIFADMPAEREKEIFELAEIPEVKAFFLNWMSQQNPEQFDRQVKTWLASTEIGDRRAGILAIGEVGAARHITDLSQALSTETEPSILALTLHGLRRFQADSRVGSLVKPFLRHADETVQIAAIEALPLTEDDHINALIKSIGDPSETIRSRAIERLEKLPAEKQHLLVAQMGTHSRWVRDGLFEIAARLDLKDVDIFNFCRNQLQVAYEAVERSHYLNEKPENVATRMMQEHLEEVRQHRVNNAIMGVAAKDSEGRIKIALRGLNSGKERERSDSIEALEALLDRPLANLLLPMLDNRPDYERLAVGRKHYGLAKLTEQEFIEGCLKDASWVTVIMVLECLAIWGNLDPYRSAIEKIATEDYGGLAHTANHALKSSTGGHEEPLSCLIERINNIRKVDLFHDLTIGQLAAVAWESEVITFGPDKVIANAHLPLQGLQIIVSGEINFCKIMADETVSGPELHRIGAGDWFGAAFMFGMKPPASLIIKTVGDVLLIRVNRQTFQDLTHQYPAFGLQVCKGLTKSLGDVMQDLKHKPYSVERDIADDERALNGSYCTTKEECSLVDRIFFLNHIDLFRELETKTLTAIAMLGEEVVVAKGGQFKGSDIGPQGLFLVLEGDVKLYRGKDLFDHKGPGSYFGLPTLFGMEADQFTGEAQEKTTFMRIPPDEFRACVMEHPIIAIRACEKLSHIQGSLLDNILKDSDDNSPSDNPL